VTDDFFSWLEGWNVQRCLFHTDHPNLSLHPAVIDVWILTLRPAQKLTVQRPQVTRCSVQCAVTCIFALLHPTGNWR
jgi:hypothetical protein